MTEQGEALLRRSGTFQGTKDFAQSVRSDMRYRAPWSPIFYVQAALEQSLLSVAGTHEPATGHRRDARSRMKASARPVIRTPSSRVGRQPFFRSIDTEI